MEMRESGELAKYGLATLEKILKVFQEDQCVGSDIACSFMATLKWHPMYLPGVGLEDLETCERLFSASNAVARLIRHASYFHYLQFIDLHFQQWDDDKYLELTNFMYNNYKQALSIINEYIPEVEAFKSAHGYTDEDFIYWHDEEFTYLSNSGKEPPGDALKVAYVEALQKLDQQK
ncbi:hypothetical protein JB92DRAFT_3085880 [Gautieria morchelliformis]|nr:hypothetical protein JB92DRAFT_3085880 [Gautieria morchelliformis]